MAANRDIPKPYYRSERVPPAPGQPVPPPAPNVELQDQADAATVGPQRALFGSPIQEIAVPAAVDGAGNIAKAVQLKRNDGLKPMYVRVRLARNSTEGRIGISSANSVTGQAGKQNMEWLDLTTAPGRMYEGLLGPNDAMYAIGTWPGIVPLQVFVTVVAWTAP